MVPIPTNPFAVDPHEFATNEEGDALLFNKVGQGVIGGDLLGSDTSALTTQTTIVKANVVNYNDSRIIRVGTYGTFIPNPGIITVVRLWWSGSEIANAYQLFVDAADPALQSCPFSMWGIVFPGAPGSASAYATIERAGSGTVIAQAGCRLIVEDIGCTTGLYGT